MKLFLSDTHIGTGRGLDTEPYPWEWLTQKDYNRFISFLSGSPNFRKVDEVILLGDIFDGWIYPHDEKPPTFEEVVKSDHAAGLVSWLQYISRCIPTTYVPGNHDSGMTPELLSVVIPKATFATMYDWDKLHAEHGHSFDLFNASDPLRPNNLPLGYFISRVVATLDRKTGSISPGIVEEIKKLAKVIVDKETLPQGVFDAICDKARVGRDEIIVMPEDLWGGINTTVGKIREIYKQLVHEWRTRKGEVSAALAIAAACNDFSLVAEDMFAKDKIKTVVLGHTHISKKPCWFDWISGRRYVNTGCWCSNIPKATWVDATSVSHINLQSIRH